MLAQALPQLCQPPLLPRPQPLRCPLISPAALPALPPTRRRLLASPDVELLLNYDRPCLLCDSKKKYYECHGWKVDPEQGGVLWPLYHLCDCDNPHDKYYNPKGEGEGGAKGDDGPSRLGHFPGRVVGASSAASDSPLAVAAGSVCAARRPCPAPPWFRSTFPPPRRAGCKSHKPSGCWAETKYGLRRLCPFCLCLPVLTVLRKVSNHLELVKARHDEQGRPETAAKFAKALQIAELVGAGCALWV